MKQQVLLQRWYVKNIDEKEKRTEVFEKNRILAIKVGNDKWKVVVGDGKTSLGKLPLFKRLLLTIQTKYIHLEIWNFYHIIPIEKKKEYGKERIK